MLFFATLNGGEMLAVFNIQPYCLQVLLLFAI